MLPDPDTAPTSEQIYQIPESDEPEAPLSHRMRAAMPPGARLYGIPVSRLWASGRRPLARYKAISPTNRGLGLAGRSGGFADGDVDLLDRRARSASLSPVTGDCHAGI
jgi:hypothetical protein